MSTESTKQVRVPKFMSRHITPEGLNVEVGQRVRIYRRIHEL